MFPVRPHNAVIPMILILHLVQEKIERMVIDGVADAENYYASQPPSLLPPYSLIQTRLALWSNNLLDTDKTMQSFFDGCAAAGPDDCPFYAQTPEDISRNLTALYNNIRDKPVPVRTKRSYGLVDYSRLRSTVFASLYAPFATFPTLARGLADLAAGDGQVLFQITETPLFKCSCDEGLPEVDVVGDAQAAILCNDGIDIPESLEEFEKYFTKLTNSSSWGELWAVNRAECM